LGRGDTRRLQPPACSLACSLLQKRGAHDGLHWRGRHAGAARAICTARPPGSRRAPEVTLTRPAPAQSGHKNGRAGAPGEHGLGCCCGELSPPKPGLARASNSRGGLCPRAHTRLGT
jgi:hypothetical protein